MKALLVAGLMTVSLNVFSESFEGQVHSYNKEFSFLKFTNGRVVFIEKNKYNSSLVGKRVKAHVDENNHLVSFIFKKDEIRTSDSAISILVEERPPYEPTVLPSMREVDKMFDRLNKSYKRLSECSDRAHVWTYDEFVINGIKSQKVFAFFTASYINRVKFKWWFHVAPLVQVQENGAVKPMVLDHMYKDRPVTIKEWTDMMVFSKRDCKLTTKFSEYDVNPQTEDCYMIIESMYYRLPVEISEQESQNIYRKDFVPSEVSFAENLAFEKSLRGKNEE